MIDVFVMAFMFTVPIGLLWMIGALLERDRRRELEREEQRRQRVAELRGPRR